MRNRIPSEALPGSTSLEIGTKNESTRENIAIARSDTLLHVHSVGGHDGRSIFCHCAGFIVIALLSC
jgi:hypothetical protein